MTNKQRITINLQADLNGIIEQYDAAIALARRVHAECGPIMCGHGKDLFYDCPSCHESADTVAEIDHKPDCLWLAAEAVLRKAWQL